MAKPEESDNSQQGELEGELVIDVTPLNQAEEDSIEVANPSRMRKLTGEEIKSLGLPETVAPLITSAVRKSKKGPDKLIYLLRTGEGSVFEMDERHPMVQEMQIKAAGAAIDTFETVTPLQTANAIKNAISQFGYTFDGGPLQAWDFAIKAMDKMIEFQNKQLQIHQINVMQAATVQLQSDISLGLAGYLTLPPLRKRAADILIQLGLAAAVKNYSGQDTLDAADRLGKINLLFEQMTQEAATAKAQGKADRAYLAADKAKTFIGDILAQGNESTIAFSKTLIGFVFGDDHQDEGVITATLNKAGESGQKLLALIQGSGQGINGFFKNLFNKGGGARP